jgi:3-methylcrotonyl-CoA carboxylase alpha subunit
MLAKVIATAETRDLAIARLTSALRQYPILGIRTNVPFLLRILEHPRFRDASIHTGFLDAEGAALAERTAVTVPDDVQAAIEAHDESPAFAAGGRASSASAWDPWQQLKGWRS